MSDEGRFMVAVGGIIENTNTGMLLLLQRAMTADFAPGIWEEITGRMKQFEELEDALRREVAEESGIQDIEVVKPLTVRHFFRGVRSADTEIVLVIYWVRTRTEEIVLSHEHQSFQWVNAEDALRVVSQPGVRRDIEAFVEERRRTSMPQPNDVRPAD